MKQAFLQCFWMGALLCLSGCFLNESITIEDSEGFWQEAYPQGAPFAGLMVFTYNHELYRLNIAFGLEPELILPASTGQKSLVALSPDKSKIALLQDQNTLVILDTTGKELDREPLADSPRDLGWGPNSQTVYYLANNTLGYYGPDLNINLQVEPGDEVYAVHVNPEGDVIYCLKKAGNPDEYAVIADFANDQFDATIIPNEELTFVRLAPDGQSFLVASNSQSRSGSFNRVWTFEQGDKSWSNRSWKGAHAFPLVGTQGIGWFGGRFHGTGEIFYIEHAGRSSKLTTDFNMLTSFFGFDWKP
ncbi:MAG: hypothetical protein AAFR61_00295 [Bacteroidota bacterium]